MSNDRVNCPNGHERVEPVTEIRQTAAEDGTMLPYPDTFTRCAECGTEFYTHEQSMATSRARAGVLRRYDNLLTPDEIRAIRERLGFSQADLEKFLEAGPKTVVRWERGTVTQSRAVDKLLRILDHVGPELLTSLTQGAPTGPAIAARTQEQYELAEWSLLVDRRVPGRRSGDWKLASGDRFEAVTASWDSVLATGENQPARLEDESPPADSAGDAAATREETRAAAESAALVL